MVAPYQKPRLSRLDVRRRSLGLSVNQLAQISGVSMPTVNRILSGRHTQATWANVLAVAHALGLNMEFKPTAAVETLREKQAARKADELARMVHATSALEAQGLDQAHLNTMKRQIARELLTGSNRKLWAK